MKTAVDTTDAIRIAYFHIVKGYSQQDVCEMMGISNVGRVAEAVVAVRWAADNLGDIYKLATFDKAAKKVGKTGWKLGADALRISEAEKIIKSCCGHDGAEGFSPYLHEWIDAYNLKYGTELSE